MCMVCNVGVDLYYKYNSNCYRAANEMKKAAAVLIVARNTVGKDTPQGKEYDRCHKKIVRMIRDWNRVTEHERECN